MSFSTKAKIAFAALILCLCAFQRLFAADDFDSLMRAGDAAVAAHHTRQAIPIYQRAAKLQPGNVDLLLKLSRQTSDLIEIAKNHDEASHAAHESLDYAQRALKLAPNNAQAHLSVSIGYGKLTDYVSNRTKFQYAPIIKSEAERATQLDPNNDVAWLVLGRWTCSMANLNPVLRFFAELVYGKLPHATNDDAIAFLRKAVRLGPDRIINRQALAKAYESAGDKTAAREQWQKILALPSVDVDDDAAKAEARAALK